MLDTALGAFTRHLLETELPISGTQMLVLIALGKYATAEGTCFPAVETLASNTALDPSTVRKAIRALEGHGLLRVSGQREGYKTNTYGIEYSLLPR